MASNVVIALGVLLALGGSFVLSGMEQYNFFVEAVQSTKSRKNGVKIQAFWFCGKLPGKDVVEMWRIREGKVMRDQMPWGKEWGGRPTRGWKKGSKGKVLSVIEKYQ